MAHFHYYYGKLLLYLVRLVALLLAVVSALLVILIFCDLVLPVKWGYPWCSIFFAFGIIAVSLGIWRAATNALRRIQ